MLGFLKTETTSVRFVKVKSFQSLMKFNKPIVPFVLFKYEIG